MSDVCVGRAERTDGFNCLTKERKVDLSIDSPMNVSWDDTNSVHEAGEYPFRDGTLVVTFVEVAIWRQDPGARFQLLRTHPIQAHPRYVLGRQVDAAAEAPPAEKLFHESSNGDTWSLTRDPATGARSVIHRPNAQSGGRSSHRQIGDFLSENAKGPEHQALRSFLEAGSGTCTILIVYDIHPQSGHVSESVAKEIQSLGAWWHHLESVWIVRSIKTPAEIMGLLGPLLGFEDQLLVIDISGDSAGWVGVNESGSQWLNENI
ncbi:MAG: hypothetical protein QOI93_5721 [Rhodospirillaceae bacterium]|nr:hypothetical protein [Rhodospirillaceae bacterium]